MGIPGDVLTHRLHRLVEILWEWIDDRAEHLDRDDGLFQFGVVIREDPRHQVTQQRTVTRRVAKRRAVLDARERKLDLCGRERQGLGGVGLAFHGRGAMRGWRCLACTTCRLYGIAASHGLP